MAYLTINNVFVRGVSACVPSNKVDNCQSDLFESEDERDKYIQSTGVKSRRVASHNCCSSDLCLKAAEKLIDELNWTRDDIDACIFVSQTNDYIYPATSCILQQKLGLSNECMCMDVSMGCPGWVYGMSTLFSLMSTGQIKKGLLLVGETVSKTRSPFDRVNMITGDAGTCTALQFDPNNNTSSTHFALFTDGAGADAIIIPDGGYRNPTTAESLVYKEGVDGVLRNGLQTHMDGAAVFSFAINKVPKCINGLMNEFHIDKSSIDYFLLHQANLMINKKIMKKLALDENHCPNNLTEFGNTSSTAIPLLIVHKLRDKLKNKKLIACGFGVGLSWAAVYFETDENIVIPKLIEYDL